MALPSVAFLGPCRHSCPSGIMKPVIWGVFGWPRERLTSITGWHPVSYSSGPHRMVIVAQDTSSNVNLRLTSWIFMEYSRYVGVCQSLFRIGESWNQNLALPPTGTCDFSKPRTPHCHMGILISHTSPGGVWLDGSTCSLPAFGRTVQRHFLSSSPKSPAKGSPRRSCSTLQPGQLAFPPLHLLPFTSALWSHLLDTLLYRGLVSGCFQAESKLRQASTHGAWHLCTCGCYVWLFL